MINIQVLMSTYNGEKYLAEQINSILSQKDVNVSLLIRDDGSKDKTREIIEKYKKSDSRVSFVFEDNIGVKKSFLRLIELSDSKADFYAFSDQDDIWQEDKLSTAVKKLQSEPNDIPLIYGSSVYLYSDNNIIGTNYECNKLELGNFLIKNYYPGCTMVFNGVLRNLINHCDYNSLNSFPLHDHWLNLVCTACGGKVIMDRKPHILYRQHNNNVIGDRSLIQKIKGNGLFNRSVNTRYKICNELHSCYKNFETENTSKLIQTILSYDKSMINRFKLAFNKNIKPLSVIEKLSIFLIILLRKF